MPSEPQEIPAPTESIYEPKPSWAPAFLALGVAALVCGIYAEGFLVRGWIYSIIGAVFFVFAFAAIVRGSIRAFFTLPRKQRVRGAPLPAASLRTPKRG
jgi:hypothetical protein